MEVTSELSDLVAMQSKHMSHIEVGVLKACKNATWGSGSMEGIWVKFLALPARPSSLLLDCAYTAHVWAWSFN